MIKHKIYDLDVIFKTNINDNSVQKLIRFFELNSREDSDWGVFYKNKERGVCAKFNKTQGNELLVCLFFYGDSKKRKLLHKLFGIEAGSDSSYSPYTGMLPYGIPMKSTKKEVELQIGKPDHYNYRNSNGTSGTYEKLGLEIFYFDLDSEETSISKVTFIDPESYR